MVDLAEHNLTAAKKPGSVVCSTVKRLTWVLDAQQGL